MLAYPPPKKVYKAGVAKLVDALDLGSSGGSRESSSLSARIPLGNQYDDDRIRPPNARREGTG